MLCIDSSNLFSYHFIHLFTFDISISQSSSLLLISSFICTNQTVRNKSAIILGLREAESSKMVSNKYSCSYFYFLHFKVQQSVELRLLGGEKKSPLTTHLEREIRKLECSVNYNCSPLLSRGRGRGSGVQAPSL